MLRFVGVGVVERNEHGAGERDVKVCTPEVGRAGDEECGECCSEHGIFDDEDGSERVLVAVRHGDEEKEHG